MLDDTNNIILTDNDDKPSKYICTYCLGSFARSDNLKKHIEFRCKVKKEQESGIEELLKLQLELQTRQIEELKKQNNVFVEQQVKMNEILSLIVQNEVQNVHTNTHNTENTNHSHNTQTAENSHNNTITNTVNGNIISNNNNTNIQIEKIEFGKEDLSKLSDKFFIKTLMNNFGAQIPQKIIEGLHFNTNIKENMNVYITDSSRNKAMIFDGKVWKEETASRVIDNLLDKAIMYCENKHDELIEKDDYDEKQKKKITKEMNTMNVIINHEPYDYDLDGQPIDNDGNIRSPDVFKERKRLYKLAKEYISLTLKNKKNIIMKYKECNEFDKNKKLI